MEKEGRLSEVWTLNPYLLHCCVCRRDMRPYKTPAGDYPGTVAQGSSDPPMCVSCRQQVERGKKYVSPQQAQALRFVQRIAHDEDDERRLRRMLGL